MHICDTSHIAQNAKKNTIIQNLRGDHNMKFSQRIIDMQESPIRKFDEEVLAYAHSQGIPELIESFIKYYKKYNINFEKNEENFVVLDVERI